MRQQLVRVSTSARRRWVLDQGLVVAVAVFCYFGVRGLTRTDPATAFAHADDVAAFEQRHGLAIEMAAQAPLLSHPWLGVAANWMYIWGHWPVIVGTMLWLAWHHQRQFLRLRDAMMVSGGMGLVVFATFPVAPPRLADSRLVDTVTIDSRAYRVLQPPAFVNQYAAMPSLHVGWDLLVGISIVTASSVVAVRVLACLLPLFMAYAVVATANHYVVDVVVGVSFALVGYAVALMVERWRDGRHGPDGP